MKITMGVALLPPHPRRGYRRRIAPAVGGVPSAPGVDA